MKNNPHICKNKIYFIKKILFIFAVLFVLSLTVGCFPTEYYKIIDIRFNAVEKEKYTNKVIEVVKDKLLFQITSETECVRIAQNHSPSLINQCYATSRGMALENSILQETFSLSFNKSFVYGEKTIESLSNLFDNEIIKGEISVYNDKEYDDDIFYNILIDFSEHFSQNAQLAGKYEITFSCKTSDDLVFTKKIIINFK